MEIQNSQYNLRKECHWKTTTRDLKHHTKQNKIKTHFIRGNGNQNNVVLAEVHQ